MLASKTLGCISSKRTLMTNSYRTKQQNHWFRARDDDPFVRRAYALHYRTRAAFKLQEINNQHNFIESSSTIVEIGAAPGGWSQLIVNTKASKNQQYKLIAIDRMPMHNISGVEFVVGDFMEKRVQEQVASKLNGRRVDLILSDVCPNISGAEDVDRMQLLMVSKGMLKFIKAFLNKNGTFLLKTFSEMGGAVQRMFSERFKKIRAHKPQASKKQSSEMFLLCGGGVVDGNRTHDSRNHTPELYH